MNIEAMNILIDGTIAFISDSTLTPVSEAYQTTAVNYLYTLATGNEPGSAATLYKAIDDPATVKKLESMLKQSGISSALTKLITDTIDVIKNSQKKDAVVGTTTDTEVGETL